MKLRHSQIGSILHRQCMVLVSALSLTAVSAFGWGPGVHAYVADQVNKQAGWKNVNEMYGGMAPDVINYMFSSPYLGQMYSATHFNFQPLWQACQTKEERTLALGFLTHNNAWGSDYTAHSSSLTLNPSKGYIIQKAEILVAMLKQDPGYASLGIPDAITLEICHPMVEVGVELLVRQMDPAIGGKVVRAVTERNDAFPALLAKAYAEPFAVYFGNSPTAAAQALVEAEYIFRQITQAQGIALQQETTVALDQLADINAALAEGFLAQYGVTLPSGFEMKTLIKNLIVGGMTLCQDDYEQELQATVEAVKKNLAGNDYKFPQY